MGIRIDDKGVCHIENKSYPAIGFGTYPSKGQDCRFAVEQAAKQGYRIMDTATMYKNFEPIGEALKSFGRKNFYLTSKVWPDSQSKEGIKKDVEQALEKLDTDYLDAYLLHWPNSKISLQNWFEPVKDFLKRGIIRHFGLSNITTNHLKRALDAGVPVSWVQVEMHPLFCDSKLLNLCKSLSITPQAWSPIARGRVFHDETVTKIAKKQGKTPSQVALRWIFQHGCLPLPGSKSKEHIKENFEIMDFVLSSEEMEEIDRVASRGQRKRITKESGLGFTDEFDFFYEECWPK